MSDPRKMTRTELEREYRRMRRIAGKASTALRVITTWNSVYGVKDYDAAKLIDETLEFIKQQEAGKK